MANKRRRRGGARVPIVSTLIAALPEITVGVAAAADLDAGKPSGEIGARAVKRFEALYGLSAKETAQVGPVTLNFDVGTNATAKVAGSVLHVVMRWAGLRIPIGRRATLF